MHPDRFEAYALPGLVADPRVIKDEEEGEVLASFTGMRFGCDHLSRTLECVRVVCHT
jgi:hypothetical protein